MFGYRGRFLPLLLFRGRLSWTGSAGGRYDGTRPLPSYLLASHPLMPHRLAVSRQSESPAVRAAHACANLAATARVALKAAVLEIDAGARGALSSEADLDLARVRRVGVELPIVAQMRGHRDPLRWVPGEHVSPFALYAIRVAFEP